MKKKNDLVRKISSIVLGGFLAILLCAPNVRAQVYEVLEVPSGETMVIDESVEVTAWMDVHGTAIIEGGAKINSIYVFPGEAEGAQGGTVIFNGCTENHFLGVLKNTSFYKGLLPEVTIYGYRFDAIDMGVSFSPPADEIIVGTLNVINELEELQFWIWIDSEVPIHLSAPESDEPERIEAELRISPSVMNRNRRCPVVCAMIRLPEGIEKDDVDDDYPLMIYTTENDYGVEARYKRIFQSCRKKDSRVKIFAFFNVGPLLQGLPEDCEQMQLQVCGRLKTEQEFYGNDEIKILQPRRKRWSYMKNWKSRKPYRHR